MVCTAVGALRGSVGADTGCLFWGGGSGEALEAWVGTGGVRLIAADAAALWVGGAFWAAGSWVAKLPAEGALGGGGGRPHGPDWANSIEQ